MRTRLWQRLFGPVVVEATIPAPTDAVYDVLADPTTYPDWLVGAQDVRRVDDDFPARGSSFDHSVGAAAGPLNVDDQTESLGATPGRHVALAVHAGPFDGRVDFDLQGDGDGEATRLRFSERPTGAAAALTPVLRPTLAARNRESLRRLTERFAAPAPRSS